MKLLLLIDSEHSIIKESLDAALTSAVFGLEVSLLFTGSAIRHLEPTSSAHSAAHTANQQAANNEKPTDALQDLALYGIENVYVAQDALTQSDLDAEKLTIAVTPLDQQDVGTLLSQQATVLHF
ncbi:DsrE family protein [Pseudomaricurvus sp.]|uniref:DsrE family protein n=1 Tax=Pseudomaricurvus sp. TaxID=2004510 RepID=UPI003F6A7A69